MASRLPSTTGRLADAPWLYRTAHRAAALRRSRPSPSSRWQFGGWEQRCPWAEGRTAADLSSAAEVGVGHMVETGTGQSEPHGMEESREGAARMEQRPTGQWAVR